MSLVLYSSSDTDDDHDHEENNPKRFKSQLTSVTIRLENEIDIYEKDCGNENDRTRLFPHERGNWALAIYAYGKKKKRKQQKFISIIFFKLIVHLIWIQ